MDFTSFTPRMIVLIAFTTIVVIHRAFVILFRLFYSPIAKFPGPKLAAATGWYEFYFDFVKNGKYVFEIERLHNFYGSIIRINPHELSIRDPDFYDKLYVSGSVRKTDNYNHFIEGIDFEGSHFLTTPHDLHRLRRKPLEPFFSPKGISKLEPKIHALVRKLVSRFHSLENSGAVVRLDYAMLCYTGDVIIRVCCESPTYLLDDESFSADWYESLHTIIKSMPLFQGFPWIIRIIRFIPKSFLLFIDPRSQLFNDWRDMAERHVFDVKREKNEHGRPTIEPQRMTLLQHLVRSGLPESELSVPGMVNEAQVLLGAGTVGTARVLDLACFYILSHDAVRKRMADELESLMAEWPKQTPTWTQLEKLPYFQAVMKESLRLAFGVMRRLPRISPNENIKYGNWVIPRGVPVGMSAYMQHNDPEIFQQPGQFLPERWLPENVTPKMKKNLVPFSKGSRNCLGMNLAYAEMNHILAALFRKEGPKFYLYETDHSDISLAHDFVVPLPRVDTRGVRIIFSK